MNTNGDPRADLISVETLHRGAREYAGMDSDVCRDVRNLWFTHLNFRSSRSFHVDPNGDHSIRSASFSLHFDARHAYSRLTRRGTGGA